jgi:hypothetical protein
MKKAPQKRTRHSYGAAMLWMFGLSAWEDVIPLLDPRSSVIASLCAASRISW